MLQILSLMSNSSSSAFLCQWSAVFCKWCWFQRGQILKLVFKAILVLLDALEDVCKCNFSLREVDRKSPHGFIFFTLFSK